jgi:hypothetical protein
MVDSQYLADFFGRDPLKGEQALERLAPLGSEILAALLPVEGPPFSSSQQSMVRLRRLCRILGRTAIPHLIEAIKSAPWHTKTQASPCFAAFTEDWEAFSDRRRLLEITDFDVRRIGIEAIGYYGKPGISSDIWNVTCYDHIEEPSLASKYSTYSFGKLMSHAVEAFIRIFGVSGNYQYLQLVEKLREILRWTPKMRQ